MKTIPVLWIFYLLSPGIPLLILTVFRRVYRLKRKRAPFVGEFLRSPGESTNRKIQALNEDIQTYSFYLFLLPILFPLIIVISFKGDNHSQTLVFGAVIILLSIVFYGTKLWRRLKLRRILRLGYDGEVAVGQEINQLMLDGYHVYHDFPAKNFNIDHIIVGSSGVYAVETKARSKLVSKQGVADYKFISDGRSVRFPNYTDTDSLRQAKRQAKWLQKWMSKAIGDRVRVSPILTFPGWFVEQTSPGGTTVLNPKMIRSFLNAQKEDVLSESMLQRINHRLDQKCRDIEPTTVQVEKAK